MKIYQINEGSTTRGWVDNTQELDFLIERVEYTSQIRNGVLDKSRDYVVRMYSTAMNLIYKEKT